ncbi:MAG: sensor histidine kinase [Gammaproteobacteria bacterium]
MSIDDQVVKALDTRPTTSRLLWKLLAVIALVIVLALIIAWLAIDFVAFSYFSHLLTENDIPNKQKIMQMFLDATHQYLAWAGFAALLLALLPGFLLIKMILRPLYQMIAITRKIADGDYSAKVDVSARDEVGKLGNAFNSMIASLRRTELLRKNMVVDIAHELRAPLTNIRGYLEAMSDGVLAPSTKIVELLHEETLRLGNLSEDLLRLSVADAARLTLQRETVDLSELLTHALTLFGRQFADKAITVETQFLGEQEIMADSEKLAQVIQNLLDNAWQYTPHGGHVRITVERLPGSVKATFANTGDPISEKDLPSIFECFYRADKSRSREHGGAGIGLAIVKELVEAHNGRVGSESSASETCIWFTLPA